MKAMNNRTKAVLGYLLYLIYIIGGVFLFFKYPILLYVAVFIIFILGSIWAVDFYKSELDRRDRNED